MKTVVYLLIIVVIASYFVFNYLKSFNYGKQSIIINEKVNEINELNKLNLIYLSTRVVKQLFQNHT